MKGIAGHCAEGDIRSPKLLEVSGQGIGIGYESILLASATASDLDVGQYGSNFRCG
jgi:hypothetical protein